jgi:hypothetical protein
MMTFEQFQATGRAVDNLGDHISDMRFEEMQDANEIVRTPGRLYLGELYIENVTVNWPEAALAKGKWYLLIERDEYITNDLAALERRLYDWAMASGYEDWDSNKLVCPLIDEYRGWTDTNGFPYMSADELLAEYYDTDLMDEQKAWLTDFIRRWELVSRAPDANADHAKGLFHWTRLHQPNGTASVVYADGTSENLGRFEPMEKD